MGVRGDGGLRDGDLVVGFVLVWQFGAALLGASHTVVQCGLLVSMQR